MKSKKQLTNLEMWNIISKQYIGTKEIQIIGCLGRSSSQKLRRDIEFELKDWLLPKNQVPTESVLKKLNIDAKKIYTKARMERELK